ncbi:MAG: hypothetical protein AAGK02_02270 [Pseudomonadota bacterium]
MLELLASEYRGLAQDILAIILIAIAFRWGGGPERVVAATWLVLFEVASVASRAIWGSERQLSDVDVFFASTDILACVIWVAVALCANRTYTLWIAAMQLLAVTAHLARGLVEAISPVAYLTMVYVPGWFQLMVLAIGLARHINRKRRYGEYRDWRVGVPDRFVPVLGRGPG